MNQIWVQVFVAMIVGNIVKYLIPNPLIWACIDVVMLGVYYMILRRHPNVDMNTSMTFLGGLTVVSILTDLRIINDMIGNIAILGLLGWLLFARGGGNRPKGPTNRHKWHK